MIYIVISRSSFWSKFPCSCEFYILVIDSFLIFVITYKFPSSICNIHCFCLWFCWFYYVTFNFSSLICWLKNKYFFWKFFVWIFTYKFVCYVVFFWFWIWCEFPCSCDFFVLVSYFYWIFVVWFEFPSSLVCVISVFSVFSCWNWGCYCITFYFVCYCFWSFCF